MTHACDVIRECGEISPSLQARMGTGGNQIPLCYGIGNGQANEAASPAEEVSQTLNTMHDAQAVFIPDKAHSLRANGADPHREDAATYVAVDCRNGSENENVNGTLQAKSNGGISYNLNNVVRSTSVVRRLTPLECTRLQGFPDGWVDIGDWVDTKGKKHKDADSPKYKALGNSIALPFWRWMFQRMAEYLPEKAALGSLFDGIGGFPKCWEDVHGAGTALWASEIEEFPIAVTKTRFPGMEHLGDITKLNGAKLKPVHAVAGGSPCQDLSVAGKRKGLEGERSGLFMEQIRVVKEMRESSEQSGADEPVWPRYMVWENVPGALSCNGGRDFAAVLEETIRIADPEAPGIDVPEKGWPNWGGYRDVDGRWSVAWRVHDAQFWGVPQRRRRISLVADFGGGTAHEILFERKSVSGDPEPGTEAREGAADSPAGCTDTAEQNHVTPYCISSYQSNAMLSDNPHSGIYEAETSRTLDGNGGNPGCNQGGIAVVESYAIQGSMIGRDDKNGPQGDGINEDVSFTLNTVDRHAVCTMTTGSFAQASEGKAPIVLAHDHKDPTAVCYGIGRDTFNQGKVVYEEKEDNNATD